MNWFERYGIPGLYFSSYVFLCVFLPHLNCVAITTKSVSMPIALGEILTIFFGLSLPAGYLISVLTMWLYYKFLWWQHIHRHAMNRNKCGKDKEEELEAETVKLFRLDLSKDCVEKCRWVSEWVSKRVDVIAMNNSILVATIIGYFLSRYLHNQIFYSRLPHEGVVCAISTVIVLISLLGTNVLLRQVKIVIKSLHESKDEFMHKE